MNSRPGVTQYLRRQGGLVAGGTDQQAPATAIQVAAVAPGEVGLEGNLDVETLLGLASSPPLTIYNMGGDPRPSPLLPPPRGAAAATAVRGCGSFAEDLRLRVRSVSSHAKSGPAPPPP